MDQLIWQTIGPGRHFHDLDYFCQPKSETTDQTIQGKRKREREKKNKLEHLMMLIMMEKTYEPTIAVKVS